MDEAKEVKAKRKWKRIDIRRIPAYLAEASPEEQKQTKLLKSLMSYPEFKNKLLDMPQGRNRAIIALMYAGLARVGEIVESVRQKDLNRQARSAWYEERRGRQDKMDRPLPKKKIKYSRHEGMLVKDINKKEDCIELTLMTEKNPKQSIRRVPVPYSEKWLTDIILEFYEGQDPEMPVAITHGNPNHKSMTRFMAYKIVKKKLGIHPHALRHMRASHLLSGEAWLRPVSTAIVQEMGGWGNLGSLDRYKHLNIAESARKFWEA